MATEVAMPADAKRCFKCPPVAWRRTLQMMHPAMTRCARALLLSALLVAASGGCVHYEYDVVQPPELARHVGTKQWTSFRRDALEYKLLTSDDRLVMLIYNRGERAVKLSGSDSA